MQVKYGYGIVDKDGKPILWSTQQFFSSRSIECARENCKGLNDNGKLCTPYKVVKLLYETGRKK